MRSSAPLALLGLVALSGFATTQDARAVPEARYAEAYRTEVDPFYASGVAGEFLSPVDGTRISYRAWINPNESAAVVVVNGRTETYVKYAETALDLARAGYSVYALDHRGQGMSGRLLRDPRVGYVKNFQDYVTDLKYFVDHVVNAVPHAKRFMLGHSMGGGISALYCSELNPNDMDAVVLSSPMLSVDTAPYKQWEAYDIAEGACLLGLGTRLAPGQTADDTTTFATNDVTHSEVRWDKAAEITADYPRTYLGGASNRWVEQSLAAGTRIRGLVNQVKAPVLLFQAGADKLVLPDGEDYFCSHARECREIKFPGSYHEILNEHDAIRDPAIAAILGFYQAHL